MNLLLKDLSNFQKDKTYHSSGWCKCCKQAQKDGFSWRFEGPLECQVGEQECVVGWIVNDVVGWVENVESQWMCTDVRLIETFDHPKQLKCLCSAMVAVSLSVLGSGEGLHPTLSPSPLFANIEPLFVEIQLIFIVHPHCGKGCLHAHQSQLSLIISAQFRLIIDP